MLTDFNIRSDTTFNFQNKIIMDEKLNEINYEFIASSKVIRHMFDPKTADVLATLIYKQRYWNDTGKLFKHKGQMGFYISLADIMEETSFGKETIQKRIENLKKAGLIGTIRQGLNKPNFYYLDEAKISNFIKKHEPDYEKWRLSVRGEKVSDPIPLKETEQFPNSGNGKSSVQEKEVSTLTNNKITNNKITNNFTNRSEAEKVTNSLSDVSDILESLIDDLKNAEGNDEVYNCILALFDFLSNLMPTFVGFEISEKDEIMIANIKEYKVYSFIIADKILKNAQAVNEGKKANRFGNLFVGLSKMDEEFNLKYSS